MTFNTIKYSLFIGIGIVSGLAVIYLFSSYAHIPVNPDAGYYIPMSELVLNGATPTVDVNTLHAPGVYYIYALWMKVFGSDYETLLLLIYIVNAANSILLYLILSEFIQQKFPKIIICFSYYYSIMLLGGTSIELEPFQIIFILLAYLVYLKKLPDIVKHILVGLCLGCSIMFKQYSILVLFGFLMMFWLDIRENENNIERLKRIFITIVFALMPFFTFIFFTKASLVHSLYSFGLLGNAGISYATAEQAGVIEWGNRILRSIIVRNWLFLPFFIYVFILLFRRDYLRFHNNLIPLFVFSCMPLAIRQYSHYFQLIAPWSYLILGILLKKPAEEFRKDDRNDFYVIVSLFICFFIILPVFLVFTPALYYPANPGIRRGMLLFSIIILSIISWGIYHSKNKMNLDMLLVLLSSTIFLVTILFSLKIPFSEMRDQKYVQLRDAEEINKIFPKGSSVFVIDYPQLNYTCRFRNPFNNFNFPLNEQVQNLNWNAIDNVVVKKTNPFISSGRLAELGYKEIEAKLPPDIALFSKIY
jgi:hypothetical protein